MGTNLHKYYFVHENDAIMYMEKRQINNNQHGSNNVNKQIHCKKKCKCRVLSAGEIKSIYKNTVNTQLLQMSLTN